MEKPTRRQRPRRKTIVSMAVIILSNQFTLATGFSEIYRRSIDRKRKPIPKARAASSAVANNNSKLKNFHGSGLYLESLVKKNARNKRRKWPNISPVKRTKDNLEPSLMPTWLALPRSHLIETNLEALQKAMQANGLFTRNESLKLLLAIEEAAGRDRSKSHSMIESYSDWESYAEKVAGAAEFCLLLVETMEMGLNALVAAAFDYCSCVTARERSQPPSFKTASTQEEPTLLTSAMESYGAHAVEIARHAARLKQLEWVAATVMDGGYTGSRVLPDSTDAENLRQLFLSEAKDWRALAIRSAACLFRLRGLLHANNVSDSRHVKTPEHIRAGREALYIFAPLATQMGMNRLKCELEGAAFRILYQRQYDTVNKLARQELILPQHEQHSVEQKEGKAPSSKITINIGQAMRKILADVQAEMTHILEQDEEFSAFVEDYSVTARMKEPYSMWRKMLRTETSHILEVPDAIALRIVLDAKTSPNEDPEIRTARERVLCYFAQRLCMQNWKPVEGNPRFKDYIKNPKPNGYQSLHYTASTKWGGEEWTVEIQIRSGDMHQVAEFGLASHWEYKANTRSNSYPTTKSANNNENAGSHLDHSTDAYLRRVQQWHWEQRVGASKLREYRKKKDLQHPLVDASPASSEPVISSDIWQGRVRADRIRARTQRLQPYIQALSAAQSDLARESVFIFVSQQQLPQSPPDKEKEGRHGGIPSVSYGKVLALPAGACVLDALREYENMIGSRDAKSLLPSGELSSPTAELNGSKTSLTRRLQNGDVLTISATPKKAAVTA